MNAVIYARYSSHNQTEQSIEGQLRDNYAWAKQQDITVVGEYIDRAITGTRDLRPDFQRMITDAEKKQFEMVIVWKLDRFARNRYDSAIYKARLKKYGVRVVSVKENITDNPEGIILEGLLESMAEYYSANLSQNIRRGIRESIAKGHYLGGQPPFGYKTVDHKLVPDEKTAHIVRYIFEQYASGVAKKDIVADLNAKGYRNKAGRPFTPGSFHSVLANTVYIGHYKYGGTEIDCVTEPLIDEKTFQQAQNQIIRHKHAPAAKSSAPYLLQGKVFCGVCGAPMIAGAGTSHTGQRHTYYICSARRDHHACAKKNEKREALEDAVIDHTLRYILTPARAAKIASAVVAQFDREFSQDGVESLEKAIAQIDRESEKLVDALIEAPKVAHPKIYARMETLEAQKQDLTVELARLRIAAGTRLTETEVLSWLRSFRTGNPDDPAFRARLVNTFVNTVYVYEDRIVIFYNIHSSTPGPIIPSPDSPTRPPNPLKSSNLITHTPLKLTKVEPMYVFVNGFFGVVIDRGDG